MKNEQRRKFLQKRVPQLMALIKKYSQELMYLNDLEWIKEHKKTIKKRKKLID